jgi:hypothetical protein
MMSSTVWRTFRPVAPVGSHPLRTVPVSGQPHCSDMSTRLVVYDDTACPHVLQMTR